jgi:hypothetical protein
LFYCLLPIAFLLSSCQTKTKQLLVKKWDCVQVENITPAGNKFMSPEDSVTTVQGTYEITGDEKKLICTPDSKNNVNSYIITKISESDLVLTSAGTTTPLILHFRPN